MKRALAVVLALAAAWRVGISWWTPIPSEDGVNYLWMAERLASGCVAEALGEVFPPLTAMLVAPLVALGVDPFRAGQAVLGAAGVLAAWMAFRAARRVADERSAAMAAALLAFSPLLVRFGAECYSEPLFVLAAAAALDAGLAGRFGWLGAWSGAAFWARPEGALLAAGFVLASPRRAWPALGPLALLVAALGLLRGLCGHGFSPIAKAPLIAERAVTAAPDVPGALAQVWDNALALPGLWLEAFGVLGIVALWGFVRLRGAARRPLAWIVALDLAVICAFLARRRFLLSQAAAVTVAAAAGLQALPRRWMRLLVLALGLATSLVLGARVMAPDRVAEREVGRYLGARLRPDEAIASDMTRVLWFAGRRPLTPRRFSAEELVAMARRPGVRFVVLGARRPTAASVRRALADEFDEMELPAPLRAAALERGIMVLARRE